MRLLLLYGRPGCHLCDEARAMIQDLLEHAHDVQYSEVDIDRDDALLRRYLERIPVVMLDGAVISELVPDRDFISAALLHTSSR